MVLPGAAAPIEPAGRASEQSEKAMSIQTKDLPVAPTKTGLRERKPDPVCIEIPVQVRSIDGLPIPGVNEIPKSFREDTRTLIVFQSGGVLRMTTKVQRGQMLAVMHVKSGQEASCRVVNVRNSGPQEEYVEVEFTQRVNGFWGMHFPSDSLNEQADLAREKADADRLAAQEATRLQAEKVAAEKEAQEKARRQAEEKAAAERLEAAKLAEQAAAQRAEAERLAVEREVKRREEAARREAERQAELAEQERLAEMRAAAECMARERAEAERAAAERAAADIAAKAREREEKLAAEKAVQEKAEAQAHAAKLAAAKLAAERAEAERVAAERAAEELAAKAREREQQLAAERAAQEKLEAEARAARDKKKQEAEETRAILAKIAEERRAAEVAAAQQAAEEKAQSERMATERAADTVLGYGLTSAGLASPAQERSASRERAAKEKSDAVRKMVEDAAAEKAAKLASAEAEDAQDSEQAQKERLEKDRKNIIARLEKERVKNEKAAAAKIAADEKRAAKALKADARAAARSGAAVPNTLFGGADEIAVAATGEDAEIETPHPSAHPEGAAEELHSPSGHNSKAPIFGSLGAEIAHDRHEIRSRKSHTGLILGIAASVLLLAGGGAWWFMLGPGSAARDKSLPSDAQTAQSPFKSPEAALLTSANISSTTLPAASSTASSASYASGSPVNPPANTAASATVGLSPATTVNPNTVASSSSRPVDRNTASAAFSPSESKVEPRNVGAAKNSGLDAPGNKNIRSVEAASKVKDSPLKSAPAAAKPIETTPAGKIIARPALDATLRAPVKINPANRSTTLDAVPLPDVSSASPQVNNSAASVLEGRAGASNPVAPPPPMGGRVVQGRLLKSVPPQYPEVARQRHVDGDVVVRADVDANGNVMLVTPLSGPDLLRSAAINSVKQWKYSPALLNGQPVAMQVQVTVKFRAAH